jgi:hypothetical protein
MQEYDVLKLNDIRYTEFISALRNYPGQQVYPAEMDFVTSELLSVYLTRQFSTSVA